MHDHDKETLLLICGAETDVTALMTRLYDAGVRVVGPTQTASMALALAAQTGPSLALIAGQPTGERKAAELAGALLSTWGVRSMLLDPAQHAEHGHEDWRAPDHQVARIRQALARAPLPA